MTTTNNSGSENKKLTPHDYSKEETVTMIFPKRVVLNVNGTHIPFEEGTQEVPLSLSTHWYLKDNGVKQYVKKTAEKPQPSLEQRFQGDKNEPETEAEEEEVVDLDMMNKQELVEHAFDVHGIELKPALKKEEMIAAITAAQQESQTK